MSNEDEIRRLYYAATIAQDLALQIPDDIGLRISATNALRNAHEARQNWKDKLGEKA